MTSYTIEHDGITIAERDTEEDAREYVNEIEPETGYGNALGTYHVTQWSRDDYGEPWSEDWSEKVREVTPEDFPDQ
jgi:hypothetical protein